MKKFKVNYRTDIISENTTIVPDGYTSIEFENIGEDDANLMDLIPLNPANRPRTFTNVPPDTISERMKLSFAGKSQSRKILVIKTYYNE